MIDLLPHYVVPVAVPSTVLESLADGLVTEFLALEREGYVRCGSICLFGCDSAVMQFIGEAMTARFEQFGRFGFEVSFQMNVPRSSNGKYCIDVGYFLKAHHLLNKD